MFVVQARRNRLGFVIQRGGVVGHARDRFQDDGVVRGGGGIGAPGERTVAAHQHSGNGIWIQVLEGAKNDGAGILFVFRAISWDCRSSVTGTGPWKVSA